MNKYFFTTELGKLLNPPLQSKFDRVQQDTSERIYASNEAPLGHARITNNDVVHEKRFESPCQCKDNVEVLIYPSMKKKCHSAYTDSFRPPASYQHTDFLPAAGLIMSSYDTSGNNVKKAISGGYKPKTTIVPIRSHGQNRRDNDNNSSSSTPCNGDPNGFTPSKSLPHSLYYDLWKISQPKEHCSLTKFTSFLKSNIQHFKENITVSDIQSLYHKLGLFVSSQSLERVLSIHHLLEEKEVINYSKLLKCLKWKPLLDGSSSQFRASNVDLRGLHATSGDKFQTSSSNIGDHRDSVLPLAAGISTIRRDLSAPHLRHLDDVKDYGEFGDIYHVIQPNIFEFLGINHDDSDMFMSKQKMKSLFFKSGVSYDDAAFDSAWTVMAHEDKASILDVWNQLKISCMTHSCGY